MYLHRTYISSNVIYTPNSVKRGVKCNNLGEEIKKLELEWHEHFTYDKTRL